MRDKNVGPRVVPIIPDEARTFGMEGMFRQLGIYSSQGQLYEPVDKDQVMYYREDKKGQILEEGINEAGAMSSWIAAATSYSTNNRIMVPFYIFYSMFGFQRVGDLAWAAGDMQARGFLLGATAGRTTLNGEGLQHQDGHSHLMSATIPNCVSYDPTFAHEVAVIIQHGLKRMVENQENVWYYITVMNENYPQPGLKKGQEDGILRGCTCCARDRPEVAWANRFRACSCLAVALFCGRQSLRPTCSKRNGALRVTYGASRVLPNCGATASTPSAGTCCIRATSHASHMSRSCWRKALARLSRAPITCACLPIRSALTFRAVAIIEFWVPTVWPLRYARQAARVFEVDRRYVTVAALRALADEGIVPATKVADAIKKYGIDANKPNPVTV